MLTSCADERQVFPSYGEGEEQYTLVDAAWSHTLDDQQVAENHLVIAPVSLLQLFREENDACDGEQTDARGSKHCRRCKSTKETQIKTDLFARQQDTAVPPHL